MHLIETENFYSSLLQWDLLKWINVLLNIFILFVGPSLLYIVIWYERYGADLMYRTLLNQLLSHLCYMELFTCVMTRINYFGIFCFGQVPGFYCNASIFFGRFSLVVTLSQITIRQILKYLYIFKWKNIVGLNDNFFALFVTLVNLFLSTVFVFATYFLGFHNDELDYHICTGRRPQENVLMTLKEMKYPYLLNLTNSSEWIRDVYGRDLVEIFSKYVCLTLFLLVFQTWFYSFFNHNSKLWDYICCIFKCNEGSNATSVTKGQNEKFEETKSNILGTSQTVLMLVFGMIAMIPVAIARIRAKQNIEHINGGNLRILFYISKISMPTFYFLLFPLLMLAFNYRIRKYLIKELKESRIKFWSFELLLSRPQQTSPQVVA
jgi:hypothetical protein